MSDRNRGNRKTPSNGSRRFSAWGDKNANIVLGCPNRCRYCYAKAAAKLYGRIQADEEWGTTYHRLQSQTGIGEVSGETVRFPTTHDITPRFLEDCVITLKELLAAGNRVIICSKPRLEVIKCLCKEFANDRANIQFRFCITAMDDTILGFWEPGAPDFNERLACLRHVYRKGYRTSVNIEPMLDSPNVVKLFRRVVPYVNVFVNIDKMRPVTSNGQPRTRREEAAIRRIQENQTNDRIHAIYEALRGEPLVRWGRWIRKDLGLKKAKKSG
ncbi:hypothetical protein ACFL5Q_04610 [Planctomycetota bacterium]